LWFSVLHVLFSEVYNGM